MSTHPSDTRLDATLKPCICGCSAAVEKVVGPYPSLNAGRDLFRVECGTCDVAQQQWRLSEAEAISAWNRRPNPPTEGAGDDFNGRAVELAAELFKLILPSDEEGYRVSFIFDARVTGSCALVSDVSLERKIRKQR